MTITNKQRKVPSEKLMLAMTIGERLRWLIETCETTQTALAEQTGLTQSAISNLVTDSSRKPSAPSLLKLAKILRVNPQWILDGRGDPWAWAPVESSAQVELLDLWETMTPESRQALIATARQMATK